MAKRVSREPAIPDDIQNIMDRNDELSLIQRDARGLLDVNSLNTHQLISKMSINDSSYYKGDISRIVGKDKATGVSLEDGIMSIFKESTSKINSMNHRRFIRNQVLENRWMMAEMPHLKHGLAGRKTSVFTPDDVTKSSFAYSSPQLIDPIGDDVSVKTWTISKIKTMLKDEVDFEKLMNDAYDRAQEDGFVFIYKVKLAEIAKQLATFAKSKSMYKQASLISEAAFQKPFRDIDDYFFDIAESVNGESVDILEGFDPMDISGILDTFDINEHYMDDPKKHYFESVFPANPFTDTVKQMIKLKLMDQNKDMIITEAKKSDTMRSFYTDMFGTGFTGTQESDKKQTRLNITGMHTELLDSERVIPIMIGTKVLGLYYLEDTDVVGFQRLKENANSIVSSYTSNLEGGNTIVHMLRKIVERNIDVNFLKNNKHILSELRNILNSSITGNDTYKLRWIPAKYLELYTDRPTTANYPLGSSILQDAKAGIYAWVMEHKNIQLTELFHKRPKMIVSLNLGGMTDDVEEYVMKAVESIEKMYSGANLQNIYDVDKMYSQMSNIARTIIPKGPDGNPLIDIDIREGQKTDDNIEILKMYERIITVTMNITVSSFEENYNFATSEINRTNLSQRIGVELQKHHSHQISRIATNMTRELSDDDELKDIDVKVTLPAPRFLSDQNNSSLIDNITSRAEKVATIHYGEATTPKAKAFISFYATKYLQGIEDLKEDREQFEREYEKLIVNGTIPRENTGE